MDASTIIWSAVDRLSIPAKHAVSRDDGTITWALVMSLWDQANDRLFAGKQGEGGSGSLSERNLLDLDLMEVRAIIAETTTTELLKRDLDLLPGTPAQIRRLAGHVIGHEPDELWWWEYRFTSWARQLATHLQAYDREARDVRLRNSACPECQAHQVVVERDGERLVEPALLVTFRDGYVQATECSACAFIWWRGAQMEALAAQLGVAPLEAVA